MKRIGIILTITLIASSWNSFAQTSNPLFKTYIDAMRQLSRKCEMTYSATCHYPDMTSASVNGKLAINGELYYDSSNVRFVLKNKEWLVMADHQARMLNVINLHEWQKEMGQPINLDVSGYLLNDVGMDEYSDFKVSPSGSDSFTVSVKYSLPDGQNIELVIYYPKDGTIPGRYRGIINYPLSVDESAPGIKPTSASVTFECRNITSSVDDGIFNDSRLIKSNGRKAQMKRFNNYRIHKKTV